ncbi:tRNA-splicing endonuclease subunit Sen2 [Diorhabda sublineata]|uniref:tRNA-splicing endonuclease subunit Sen2 n=1 Tax=Diorhabda sublineata TaxID=1163346 RepID=UPI0024E0DA2B|nr:tRNA-splicing endonuclease subunit Sen2 [Diorhabda sublineata]
MELNTSRSKKNCKLAPNLPLPIILKKDGSICKIKGTFNGISVSVDHLENMKNIVAMGYYGKGIFSRNYPLFSVDKVSILRNRQYERRVKLSNKKAVHPQKIISVPDSDDEYDSYFTNLKPNYQIDRSGINEIVCLSLEEAFFLSNLDILEIYKESSLINLDELWKAFAECDPHFTINYAVYTYFKTKNWVVKPGIKFGGDFLLYERGPPFCHASYVVILDILNKDMERNMELSRRSVDNMSLLYLNRLCETTGKELMICQVILNQWPISDHDSIRDIVIKEILINREHTKK